MRVAFVDQSGDETGGAQESLALLLANVPESIEARVVLFSDGLYANRLRLMGLSVHVLSISSALSGATRDKVSFGSALTAVSTFRQLVAILRQLNPSVVHTNSVKAHVLGGLASRFCAIPSVPHLRDALEGRSRKVVREIARTVSRERIAISQMVSAIYALNDTTIIENPLDLAKYANLPRREESRHTLGLPPEGDIVVLLGRINRWKGHDRFLRSAANIRSRVNVHFVIAGAPRFRDTEFLPELHSMVEALGLTNRVTFLDWLEDPRLLFAAADLNVNCSTREPFGRTVIEAAAAGVPTVCFDDSGVAEFMRDGIDGIIVPAGDEQRLAEAISNFLQLDDGARSVAAGRARTWARRFAAKRHADRVAEILVRASSRH